MGTAPVPVHFHSVKDLYQYASMQRRDLALADRFDKLLPFFERLPQSVDLIITFKQAPIAANLLAQLANRARQLLAFQSALPNPTLWNQAVSPKALLYPQLIDTLGEQLMPTNAYGARQLVRLAGFYSQAIRLNPADPSVSIWARHGCLCYHEAARLYTDIGQYAISHHLHLRAAQLASVFSKDDASFFTLYALTIQGNCLDKDKRTAAAHLIEAAEISEALHLYGDAALRYAKALEMVPDHPNALALAIKGANHYATLAVSMLESNPQKAVDYYSGILDILYLYSPESSLAYLIDAHTRLTSARQDDKNFSRAEDFDEAILRIERLITIQMRDNVFSN